MQRFASVADNCLRPQAEIAHDKTIRRLHAETEMNLEKLILASRRPRRAEILNAAGWSFETAPADIDESVHAGEDAITYVKRLALSKAQTVFATLTHGLVLGADTTVVINGEILGQPLDDDDARRMLKLLSGSWHEVLTGVALVRAEVNSSVVRHE